MPIIFTLITILVIIFLARLFFAGGLEAAPNSEILGTNTKSNNIYHQILVNHATQKFKHDGILLCFEKVKRKRMIVKGGKQGYYHVSDQYALFGIDQDLKCMKLKRLSNRAIRLVRSTLNDPKPLVLTHWIETNEKDHTVRYNAYEHIKGVDYNLPEMMLEQYEAVSLFINNKLETGNYTHLVITCSGWNNFQNHSTELYEDWIKFTKHAALSEKTGEDFKPFLIGFTWASRWIIPGASFLNKSNDADELGMTHGNVLIWKYLMPSIKNSNIQVISIGHSLGARVLSRALHSRFMQQNVDTSTWIGKAIDFQGAYPYTRFCEKKGNNGGLYTVDVPVRKHFMTYSKFDRALKSAFWSLGYIGNNKSASALENNPVAKNDFEFTSLTDAGTLNPYPKKQSKILVDANTIIKTIKSKFAGAHNDVRDEEAGKFIWDVLKQ